MTGVDDTLKDYFDIQKEYDDDSECVDDIEQEFLKVIQRAHQSVRNESDIHKSLHKEEEFETVEVNTNEKDVDLQDMSPEDLTIPDEVPPTRLNFSNCTNLDDSSHEDDNEPCHQTLLADNGNESLDNSLIEKDDSTRFVGLTRLTQLDLTHNCDDSNDQTKIIEGPPVNLSDTAFSIRSCISEKTQSKQKKKRKLLHNYEKYDDSDDETEIIESPPVNITDTAVSVRSQISEKMKKSSSKQKRRKLICPPAIKKRNSKNKSTVVREYEEKLHDYTDEDSDEDYIVEMGGRKYHRIPVEKRTEFTPGVRRSKRTRVQTLDPTQYIQYDHYWGKTPMKRLGAEAQYIMEPVKIKQTKSVKQRLVTEQEEHFVPLQDSVSGDTIDHRVAIPLSLTTPTNVRGEDISPGDDVIIHKFMTEKKFNSGYISFKRFSEKSRSRTGNNYMIFFIIKGKLVVIINGHEIPVSANTFVNIPPNTVYSITNTTKTQADVFYTILKSV